MKPIRNHTIVTGMHRSGTSFLVRSLNLCGLDLGPESEFFDTELQPKFGNPRGHWENLNVTQLNDKILKINGGSWHKIPDSLKKTPKNLNGTIKNILKPFYQNTSLAYGFKDPRFCITLDNWKRNISNFVIVGIFRNPLKVAESLKKRDGFDYEHSINLWKIYNEALLYQLKKNNGFLIDFDWPRKKLFEQTNLIAKKIGLMKFDFSLWYSNSYKKSDKSFKKAYPLTEEVKEIYSQLKVLSEKNNSVKYHSPKFTKKQLHLILNNLINSSNKSYSKTIELAKKKSEIQSKKLSKFIEDSPMGMLLSIYNERRDLQKKFPEVKYGNFTSLVEWANKISSNPPKGEVITRADLSKHSSWYDKYLTKIKEHEKKLQEEGSLKNDIKKNQQTIEELKNENTQYKTDVDLLKQENTQYKIDVDLLKQEKISINFELSQNKKELESIKASKGFKTTRMLGSKIDKIIRKKQVLSDIGPTISASKKTIETEGIGSFVNHARDKIKKREFLLHSPKYETTSIKLSKKEYSQAEKETIGEDLIYTKKFEASIVVPTNSNEEALKFLINKIHSQKGFKNLKIILVYSGKDDLSSLEKISYVKIIHIEPRQFSHGKTRNLGIKESMGNFLIYMTDDAIPASDHLFYDMCEVFSKDKKIAVVTTRQIPRSDSDLMSAYSLDEYYAHLNLTEDRIISTSNFDNLDSAEKRSTTQIDDVCSCYKKEILSKYKFGEVQYAEDLELGARLVKDGYKIAQLFSTGVIHSHVRPASYYVKRQFVETKVLSSLLDYHVLDFEKLGILNTKDIFDHIISLYTALNHTIDLLKQSDSKEIDEAFDILRTNLSSSYSNNSKSKTSDSSLNQIFENFFDKERIVKTESFLIKDYQSSLQNFKNFLKKTYPNLSSIEDDFFNTLYKIFGVVVGNRLGGFILFAKQKSKSNILEQINKTLESGV